MVVASNMQFRSWLLAGSMTKTYVTSYHHQSIQAKQMGLSSWPHPRKRTRCVRAGAVELAEVSTGTGQKTGKRLAHVKGAPEEESDPYGSGSLS